MFYFGFRLILLRPHSVGHIVHRKFLKLFREEKNVDLIKYVYHINVQPKRSGEIAFKALSFHEKTPLYADCETLINNLPNLLETADKGCCGQIRLNGIFSHAKLIFRALEVIDQHLHSGKSDSNHKKDVESFSIITGLIIRLSELQVLIAASTIVDLSMLSSTLLACFGLPIVVALKVCLSDGAPDVLKILIATLWLTKIIFCIALSLAYWINFFDLLMLF